jgi:tricorn protease
MAALSSTALNVCVLAASKDWSAFSLKASKVATLRCQEFRLVYAPCIATVALLVFSFAARAADHPLLLMRDPTMSKTQIVFEYGGELWQSPRSGGQAHLLAGGMGLLAGPIFSPDGSMIAFTGTYDSNTDVYVVPASGGEPRRLTYHPGPDVAVGWTPDGKSVLFRSQRYSYSDPGPQQLFTVPVTGGFATVLPLPQAEMGAYSPDGSHIAYVPGYQWEPFWKNYKGGQHTEIWIARLSDSSVVRIPGEDANANGAMWVDKTVYFLSDREGPTTLFAYDIESAKIRRLIDNHGFDITSASAGTGGIVYSQFGQLHIYDFATGATHVVPVTVSGELPQLRPKFEDVTKQIVSYDISPDGERAVFEAHGEILTVPTQSGSILNITHSPGVMERSPAWSPDGKSIAYFSDRDGEYDLYVSPADGIGSVRKIPLGQIDAYYQQPRWSPDSEKLAFADQKRNLWYVDLKAHTPGLVHVDIGATDDFEPAWSPDSRWIAYTKSMPNNLGAVFVYSLPNGKSHQVTDGITDCQHATFDSNGQYLYFTSNTESALRADSTLETLDSPANLHVYSLGLRRNAPSPVDPEAGFETSAAILGQDTSTDEPKREALRRGPTSQDARSSEATRAKLAAPGVAIDFGDIESRAVALPIPSGNYMGLVVGPADRSRTLYLLRAPQVVPLQDRGLGGVPVSVLSFDMSSRKMQTLQEGVTKVAMSASKNRLLYQRATDWFIADARLKAEPVRLELAGLRVRTDPKMEWTQMYHDAWRIERAYFFDPTFQGLDVDAAEREFAYYLPGLASRDGLTFLFREMLSYLSIGHLFVRGGDAPKMEEIKVGLLGANFNVENGHYRIVRILRGGRWNPESFAPLAQSGLDVREGDYLLAVNGNPLSADQDLYQAFEDMADKTVKLTVSANPDMQGAREITVKTISNEMSLRMAAWMEHNSQEVERLSSGRLGYVYLPDTTRGGFTNFNRYFYAQVDKEGLIVDERFNGGGFLPSYLIDALRAEPVSLLVERWGTRPARVYPETALEGPKVMIIDQFSGSGGDALPWYFKMAKIGPVVGERTWGGLVAAGAPYPRLMDGGTVTAPSIAVESLDGTLPVENHGVAPDVTVWQDPSLIRQNHDPQLERAVTLALEELREHPRKNYERSPWSNYHPHLPPLPSGD